MVGRELTWFVPALAITALTFAAAIALAPFARMEGQVRLGFFPFWLQMIAVCIGLVVIMRLFGIQRQNSPQPIKALAAELCSSRFVFLVLGLLLAGAHLMAYIFVKSELNFITPFWADDALSRTDQIVFGNSLKHLQVLNGPIAAGSYQLVWLAVLLITLTYVFAQGDSHRRNALIISYFLLWSLFGLTGQALLPSAGPIFNHRMGLADTVRSIGYAQTASDYLWQAFEERRIDVATGISAMPSLHIATMTWSVISFAAFKSKATFAMAGVALWMWLASIALGWHYAADGLVGGLMAIASFWLAHNAIKRGRIPCNA
jgi:hypothetical protein